MRAITRIYLVAMLNVAVLAAGVVAGVTVSSGEAAPTSTLMLKGTAEVDGEFGTRSLTAGDHRLVDGDDVLITSGAAVLALGEGGSLEVRAGIDGTRDSRLRVGSVPVLMQGGALLVAGPTEQIVEVGGARLRLTGGAARVARSTGATFAVYSGHAALWSAGRVLEGGLPALRQVIVPDAGLVPLAPSPLRVADPPDPWDRRFLGDAIGLDAVLERRSIGFSTLLEQDIAPDVFFFQAVLPGLLQQPAFGQGLLDGEDRPVGETLVGAGIALVSDRGDFLSRWREVFDLRGEGASWGIIAAEQWAPRDSLLSALDQAAARTPLLFRAPSLIPVFEPVRPPALSPTRPPSSVPVPLAPLVTAPMPAAPTPAAPTPPVLPPTPTPNVPQDEGLLDPVVDPLLDLLDGVLAGLGGLTDGLL